VKQELLRRIARGQPRNLSDLGRHFAVSERNFQSKLEEERTTFRKIHDKRGSRNFKEGTYDVTMGAVHLGLGLMGLAITNENKSINYRFKGITVGAGFNATIGRLVMEKL
jgi:hypothetical protein